MKVEILTSNGIKGAFKELNIPAARTYKSADDINLQVWEIDKTDIIKLEEAHEWPRGWGWWSHNRGSRLGSACEFLTVNNQFMIGWATSDGKDTYDTLIDYFHDGLKIFDNDDVCGAITGLMRTNGMSMSKLLKTFQG